MDTLMPFIPDFSQWVRDRMETIIPRETAAWCGNLSGERILDLGCGDMLAAFGLLKLAPKHIACLDVTARRWDVKQHAVTEIAKAGFVVPSDYDSRLTYLLYDGIRLPFADNHFDLVFSWGVFEHVSDVPRVLNEVRRVTKPDGRIFICVYPWFHTYTGNHLTDYLGEPFFHLTRPREWVHQQLKAFVAAHSAEDHSFRGFLGPGECGLSRFLLDHMWPEYCNLNGYSARMFLAAAMDAGLMIERLHTKVSEEHLEEAPPDVPRVDLITSGTTVLMRPAKTVNQDLASDRASLSALARARAERDALQNCVSGLQGDLEAERLVRNSLEKSRSWRITKPGRDLMAVVRKLRGK